MISFASLLLGIIVAGLNDLPPMDVSRESFRLDSRAKNADAQKEADQVKQDKQRLPPPPTIGAKLFDILDPASGRFVLSTNNFSDFII